MVDLAERSFLHSLNLGDILEEHRRGHPQDLAVVDGPVRLTYPQFADRVDQLASALDRLGVGTGDRVLWLGQNSFRVLELLLSCAQLGAVFCPGNWRASIDETRELLEDCRPRVVIWQSREIGEHIVDARRRADCEAVWVVHDVDDADVGPASDRVEIPAEDLRYEQLVRSGTRRRLPWVAPDTAVLQIYTAAFTGSPSAAQISQAGVLSQALVVATVYGVSCDYVYLNCGPLFHIGTLMVTVATFLAGGTEVFTPKAEPEQICRLVESERCTGAFLLAPTMEKIVELNSDGRFDLTSLRVPASSPTGLRAMATVDDNPRMHDGTFGQTEAMGLIAIHERGTRPTIGRAGRACPTAAVRIVDREGQEVVPGEVGEIVARGPGMMLALHERPDLTRQRQAGGWHHTGDLGRRESDGSLTWIGPMTRFIKSAQENIYPAEVEAAIRHHPDVVDAAVIGVPDPLWHQSVKAIVVVRAGATVTGEQIIEHCRARVASFKKPRLVEFVPSLPRIGPAVDYDVLDARHGGGNYPAGL